MNILYGVPGEGMGHATRSKVIITYLLSLNHNVQVVSSERAFKFLSESFPGRVHEIKGFHLQFKNAQVSKRKTFSNTLKTSPTNLIKNVRAYRLLSSNFSPDLVISDFESFAYYFAKLHKTPIISIDNMQVINRCKLDVTIPSGEKENYYIGKNIVKAKLPGCDHYFITAFFEATVRKDNTTMVQPIIRNEILKAKTSQQQHIVVYQSSSSQGNLVEILKRIPSQTFFVYGFNKTEQHGNVQLKSFSEKGFIDDLASAKAVITNGGFSLISEAVYLHKPICSIPIKNQFEQLLNGLHVEKMQYGRCFPEFSADSIKSFLFDLDTFSVALGNYKQNGNEELFKNLTSTIKTIESEIATSVSPQ